MHNWASKNIFKLIGMVALLILVLPGSATVHAQNVPQVSSDTANVPTNQIILQYKSSSPAFLAPSQASQMGKLNAATGLALTYLRNMSGNAIVLQLPAALPLDQVQKIADQMSALPDVAYAVPDQRLFPVLSPNDPYYVAGDQWDMTDPVGGIDAPAAWDITTGSPSVVVADVDTGLTNHADLAGRMVSGVLATSGYDFISDVNIANDGDGRDANPSDPGDWVTSAESTNPSGFFHGCPIVNSSWHGTHTAGTLGAATNNSLGVAGINWNSKLLIVRVLGKCGGYISDIADGITWAAGGSVVGVPTNANPARVINVSLGGSGACSPSMQTAITAANNLGAVVVVAAGNSTADVINFQPANCNGVIAVAATGRTGFKAYYSNYGSLVKISAPGGDDKVDTGIVSTLNTGTTVPLVDTYAYYEGTSMATPHVTGVVSLMFSLDPSLTPAQALSLLQSTARAFPSGSSCTTSTCGSGIVDARAAVQAASNLNPFALNISKTGTGSGTVISSPAGINCGSTCSYSFGYDTSVVLTASAAAHSFFNGWSGGGCSGKAACTVKITALTSITANFIAKVRDDYDGDGKTDPAKFDPATGIVWWLKSSTGTWDGIWMGGDTYQFISGSDFDGDGKTDPAKFYPGTGTVWWVRSSDHGLAGQWLGGDTYQYISGSDFDGDGKADPAKFYPATGTVWWVNSSTGSLGGQWLGGDSFQFVSGSDFDGDGKTDSAKFYPATGTVWWIRSSDGKTGGMWLGGDSFQYVSGSDFDGDGKTDPAKYYASTGNLWWVRSSDGKTDGAWFGPGTYTVIAGDDFNGDGKTDPAKYDSSTHTLSWLNTTTGIWTNIDMGPGTFTLVNGQ
jgi:serine protease